MSSLSELKIDLRQVILALETAVDLVGMNDTNHGKRVGYIAVQLAHELEFSEDEIHFAFELGLLHDCGVSTEQMHSSLVNHFDWESANIHCDIGYHLLNSFKPLERFATPIRHHHTPWESLSLVDISDYDARFANLIFLADRIDVMAMAHYGKDILLAKKEIVNSIKRHGGTYFDPALIKAFQRIEKSEAFWIALEDRHITRFTWDMGQFESTELLTISQIKEFALIMAYIVDQKSPFTAWHSVRVGSLARYLADTYGLNKEQCDKIEIAGFLHDIGKLRIPDYILEKAGPLSAIERTIMSQHSYETYEILRHIKGLEEISVWAAFHHEGINGTGYPFHPEETELTIESRILAVADIFQALVQDRPYRKGLSLEQVHHILDEYVDNGKLEKKLVDLAKEHGEKCFKISKGSEKENWESEIPFFTTEELAEEEESEV